MIIINKHLLRCPTCGSSMSPAININGTESVFWMKCDRKNCETYVDTYIPLDFQKSIHEDPTKYIGLFGGYGSGKTTTGLKDDQAHMLSTPRGATAVGSAVLAQVEQTYEKDFRNDFPADFILSQNKTKKEYTLVNGHNLFIKSFYEEGVIRSLTLSRFHIVEASEVDYPIFTQLQARLRSTEGTVIARDEEGKPLYDSEKQEFIYKSDWRRGIIESNPDAGWIRSNFLLQSGKIHIYGDDEHTKYHVTSPSEFISSHIVPTRANRFLPSGFFQELAMNKPAWWIRRYLQGSFDYAEGMVYPEAMRAFVDPFPIPRHWKRLIGMDYGIRNDTAILFAAIDEKNNKLYIYHEIIINNVNYKVIADRYKAFCNNPDNVPVGSLLRPPVMDARSINKRNDRDLVTIGELFLEEGIYFMPAQMDLDSRILKTNTMIESGQLKIFTSCKQLCAEIKEYKFPDRNLDAKVKASDMRPVDKFNNAINAMEFIVMEAPYDLTNIQRHAYHGSGAPITTHDTQKFHQTKDVYNPYAPNTSISSYDQYQDSDEYGDFGSIFIKGGSPW